MTDQQDVTTNTDSTAAEVVSSVAQTEGAAAVATKSAITINRQAMWYLLAFVLVALMGIGLWFMLERDGRVQTTVFSGVTEFFKASQAAAVVNGAEISVLDFESTLKQLTKNTDQQGVDPPMKRWRLISAIRQSSLW